MSQWTTRNDTFLIPPIDAVAWPSKRIYVVFYRQLLGHLLAHPSFYLSSHLWLECADFPSAFFVSSKIILDLQADKNTTEVSTVLQ